MHWFFKRDNGNNSRKKDEVDLRKITVQSLTQVRGADWLEQQASKSGPISANL